MGASDRERAAGVRAYAEKIAEDTYAQYGENVFIIHEVGNFLIEVGQTMLFVQAMQVQEDSIRQYAMAAGNKTASRLQNDIIPDSFVRSPCHSFSEETLVSTAEGLKPIGEVEIGEQVLAYNEVSGEVGYYEVTATWSHLDPEIVYLLIDNEMVETTPGHLFYTLDGWVKAGDLRVGSLVQQADGTYGVVQGAVVELKTQPMYDLTVDTAHTFFVGYGRWLVHNDNCFPTSQSVLSGLSNNNIKHTERHLDSFQALDPDITGDDLRLLGASIVSAENLTSRQDADQKVFTGIVVVGGQSITIRVALNRLDKLHSIHILDR